MFTSHRSLLLAQAEAAPIESLALDSASLVSLVGTLIAIGLSVYVGYRMRELARHQHALDTALEKRKGEIRRETESVLEKTRADLRRDLLVEQARNRVKADTRLKVLELGAEAMVSTSERFRDIHSTAHVAVAAMAENIESEPVTHMIELTREGPVAAGMLPPELDRFASAFEVCALRLSHQLLDVRRQKLCTEDARLNAMDQVGEIIKALGDFRRAARRWKGAQWSAFGVEAVQMDEIGTTAKAHDLAAVTVETKDEDDGEEA
jgi:hypothetical protein